MVLIFYGSSGRLTFYSEQSMVIRFNEQPEPATADIFFRSVSPIITTVILSNKRIRRMGRPKAKRLFGKHARLSRWGYLVEVVKDSGAWVASAPA
jgi:hypothetical protein